MNSGLKQFAFVTSHDLKTPLRNISTYLQLLKRRNTLDAESVEMVDSAVKSVKHLNQLITDIFLYTTTDFKHEGAEVVDMNELLNDTVHDFKALLEECDGTLIIPTSIPNVLVNRIQATHIFNNLVGNALKYNKSEKPVITISYRQLNNFVEFTIADNGIGIEPQYQEQIFEIFKRLHTQQEYEGTGIGLAICKKIVESYDGTIRVESEPGKGSKFIFTLPC
jgi:light-regulated signal transduction histidine kinase (bacteriophytochrome)